MIIAIEGQDGSGKSTVFNHLNRIFHGAEFIQFKETPKEYIDNIGVLEPFMFKLFEQMYDPAKVYICDRFFSVSSRVYARMRNTVSVFEDVGLDAWVMPEMHVIWLDQRVEIMWTRRLSQDENWDRVLREAYRAIMKEINPASLHIVDTEPGIAKTVHGVVRIVEGIIGQHLHRHSDER